MLKTLYIDPNGILIAWDHIQIGEDQTTRYFQNTDNDPNLVGTAQNDLILGESGTDTLKGEGGWDVLYGGQGNDILVGGPGDDVLDGGPGVDKYIWKPGDGNDHIIEQADLLYRRAHRNLGGWSMKRRVVSR